MDWSNERYVRLYTRDTDDWLALTWQARALFPLILRKVDRAGFLSTKRGAIGVAALTGLPREVVEVGLPDLLTDGAVTECDGGYLLRNFLEAQEAPQSDKQRARESRHRRRDLVTKRDTQSQNATHESRTATETSHAVTPRHTASLHPSSSIPSLPEPTQPYPSIPSSAKATTAADVAFELAIAANQAITARFGEQITPLLPSGGPASALANAILDEAIPLAFAQSSIVRQVRDSVSEPPRTIKYFLQGIRQDWEGHNARVAASGSAPVEPLAPVSRGTRPRSGVEIVRDQQARKQREAS